MIDTKEYIQNKGTRCPNSNCQSNEISSTSNVQTDAGVAWHSCMCEMCGLEWTDYYTLTDMEVLVTA